MRINYKAIIGIIVIAVLVFGTIFVGINVIDNFGKTDAQILRENTVKKLEKYIERKVDVFEKNTPVKGTVDLETFSQIDKLPEISNYPFKVKGSGEIDLEIVASPEKAGSESSNDDSNANTWLIEVVKNFNKQGYTIEGKTVSASLRSISSGVACDYISSGKYIPDAFSPSSKVWGNILQAKGINLTLESDSLLGNVAGIVIREDTYDMLINEYGLVDISTVIDATINDKIFMGYTNPYVCSTGLNFLLSSLYCFDSDDPLSDKAKASFEAFQKNVPVISYNTTQMKGTIESDVLDVLLMEYQTFVNTPELRNFIFVPFGIAHDNPLYSIDTEKQIAMELFTKFITNAESQNSAKEYGFYAYNGYVSEIPETDGNTILDAQKLWKKGNHSSQEIITVFVIDNSGSIDGVPLNNIKRTLINAAQYINPNHYVGLVTYNTNVTINLPISQFDLNQRAYFNGEVLNMSASGDSHIFDAIAVALQMLENSRIDHPEAKLMILVLSDGEYKGSLKSISSFIKNLNIPVHTIGFNADVTALQEISKINEAITINADNVDSITTLKTLFNFTSID